MRIGSALRWAPAVVLVAAAGVTGLVLLVGEDEPDPVAVASSAPTFGSLDELVAASDVVVVATVAGVDDGRAITAPDDPDAGIRTRLVELDVSDTLAGESAGVLVVEEASAFADGEPIVVDGMTELGAGALAIWFLVAGGGEAMPYYAAVNGQARFVVVGETLEPSGDDELSRALAAFGPSGLADAIRAAA
jgi:hypothetical protein